MPHGGTSLADGFSYIDRDIVRQKQLGPGMLSNSATVCHSMACSNSCSSIGELSRAGENVGIGGSTISGRVHSSDYFGRYPPSSSTIINKKETMTRCQKSPSSKYQLMYIQASCSTINGQPNNFHERERNWLKSSQNLQIVPHCSEEILELEIHANKNQSDSYLYRT